VPRGHAARGKGGLREIPEAWSKLQIGLLMTGPATTGFSCHVRQQSTRHSLLRSSQSCPRIRVDLQGHKQLEREKFGIGSLVLHDRDVGRLSMLQRSAYLGSGMIWGSRLSVVGFDCSIFSIQLYILQSQLRASAALVIEDILSTGRRRKALRASSAALQSASGLLTSSSTGSSSASHSIMGSSKEGKHC
jgi:hypothetical protein